MTKKMGGIKDKVNNPIYKKQSNQLVHLRTKLKKCKRNTPIFMEEDTTDYEDSKQNRINDSQSSCTPHD